MKQKKMCLGIFVEMGARFSHLSLGLSYVSWSSKTSKRRRKLLNVQLLS